MKAISRAITMNLSAGIFVTMFVSTASAGCGDLTGLQGPFEFARPALEDRSLVPAAEADSGSERSSGASMVGMWSVQFVSKGNTAHNPSIPDGAIIDFGYSQITVTERRSSIPGGMHPRPRISV